MSAFRTRRPRRKPIRFEMDKEESKAMRKCQAIVQKLLRHKHAWIFDRPVDPVAENIPDYPMVVKEPMDLGTVNKRLASGFYDDIQSFSRDVRLIWSNAMLYNPIGHFVHTAATEISRAFEVAFKKVEANLQAQAAEKERKRKQPKQRKSVKAERRPERETDELTRLRREFLELRQKVDRAQQMEKKRGSHRSSKYHPVSKAEKASIMEKIQGLSEEDLTALVELLAPAGSGDMEIELDLDRLTSGTYKNLKGFLERRSSRRAQFSTPNFLHEVE